MLAWVAIDWGRLWQLRWECVLYGLLVGVPALVLAPLVQDLVIRPDILRGVPWRASSTYDPFDVEKMLFHTEMQHEPHVRFDFGEATAFSALRIENRDEFRERAVPLIVDVHVRVRAASADREPVEPVERLRPPAVEY